MYDTPKNTIEFRVWGRYAMFTDPLTRVGGEKCSYHLPTYEALKGIVKSIYWKPTFIWHIDQVRVMKRIRTQTKGMKPLDYVSGGNTLAIYTYLTGDPDPVTKEPSVEYQVRAHFEWNEHRPELKKTATTANILKLQSAAWNVADGKTFFSVPATARDMWGHASSARAKALTTTRASCSMA